MKILPEIYLWTRNFRLWQLFGSGFFNRICLGGGPSELVFFVIRSRPHKHTNRQTDTQTEGKQYPTSISIASGACLVVNGNSNLIQIRQIQVRHFYRAACNADAV